MLDWRNPDLYLFALKLSSEQWAWEFLRRNPTYQQQWQSFISTWQALEACYGKPSQRDVKAWQQDERAWVPAETCLESDCRIDGDRVLIECALGARWGFYKFPPDPTDDDPVGGGRLVWREINWQTPTLEIGQAIEDPSHQAALLFDLSMPLQPQLVDAKRRLQIEQRDRIKSGDVLAPTLSKRNQLLTLYLRLLDSLSEKASSGTISGVLKINQTEVNQLLSEALDLRDHEYRQLLFLV
ncbi:MAG: DUF6499 domain-containing protein [Candidatus Thiodiazotropha sp. 6PLUC1]